MLVTSKRIRDKLWSKHQVAITEVEQCFLNRVHDALIDDREINKTTPPTQWFISETDTGRKLKVVFIELHSGEVIIKAAYKPNKREQEVYNEQTK